MTRKIHNGRGGIALEQEKTGLSWLDDANHKGWSAGFYQHCPGISIVRLLQEPGTTATPKQAHYEAHRWPPCLE